MTEHRPEQRHPDPLDWSTRAGEADADTFRDERVGEEPLFRGEPTFDFSALRDYEPIHP